jgi:phosphoribosyl 1,2-cyclic phosphodiesterase
VRVDGKRYIIDAGTGIRYLGTQVNANEELYMVFTHLHWDHIQGFPFFGPIYRQGTTIHIYSGHKADVSLESVLKGQMQEPNFPVSLGKLPATLTFNEVVKGQPFMAGGVELKTMRLNHPNEAMGLRFDVRGRSFVHLTDHEHAEEFDETIKAFCKGADVLSMDTMFTPDEYPRFKGWGHSSWQHACDIAKAAGVKKLVLFHHDPGRNDAGVDALAAAAAKCFPAAVAASEGLVIDL